MKKISNTAFVYTIVAVVAGVVYREYTKVVGFSGKTNLSLLHTHVFTLGMLVVLALETTLKLSEQKIFNGFFMTYNAGLILTSLMMAVRGFLQIQDAELSKAVNASVSGISGVGHILLGVGLILFFMNLRRTIATK